MKQKYTISEVTAAVNHWAMTTVPQEQIYVFIRRHLAENKKRKKSKSQLKLFKEEDLE